MTLAQSTWLPQLALFMSFGLSLPRFILTQMMNANPFVFPSYLYVKVPLVLHNDRFFMLVDSRLGITGKERFGGV